MRIDVHVSSPLALLVVFLAWPLYSIGMEVWARRRGWPRGLGGFLGFFFPPLPPLIFWGLVPLDARRDGDPR